MKALLVVIGLLLPSIIFADKIDIYSPRSEFRLRSNPDGRGGIVFGGGKTIGLFDPSDHGPGLLIPKDFPYTVSFSITNQEDIKGMLIIMREFSRTSDTDIVDVVEMVSGKGLRFASKQQFQKILQREKAMRAGLSQFESELFNSTDASSRKQK